MAAELRYEDAYCDTLMRMLEDVRYAFPSFEGPLNESISNLRAAMHADKKKVIEMVHPQIAALEHLQDRDLEALRAELNGLEVLKDVQGAIRAADEENLTTIRAYLSNLRMLGDVMTQLDPDQLAQAQEFATALWAGLMESKGGE